jgi:hypothetical protein
MAHNPNGAGKYNGGPHVTKQGKSGPIIGKMTSLTGSTKPWSLNKGSNKAGFVKGAKNSGNKRV